MLPAPRWVTMCIQDEVGPSPEGVEILRLQLQEIGEAMPRGNDAGPEPDPADEAKDLWRDSTLDLERGLDVVELPIEDTQPELPVDIEPPERP
jgi:hypothetical protein